MFFRQIQIYVICSLFSVIAVEAVSNFRHPTTMTVSLKTIRGGASGEQGVKKKKKRKKKKKKSNSAKIESSDEDNSKRNKKIIQDAMKEKDTAQVLGDAVRDRAADWVQRDPKLFGIDTAVSSVGWAMGTTSPSSTDGGGVEAAPNSVLAHYFLKSHGGAHAFQSVCSLLSVALGLGAIFVGSKSSLQIVLMKRTFLFAMMKHLAGVIAAIGIAAQGIRKIGLHKSRRWMEKLARDPVSQYVFYSALMIVWLSAIGLSSGTEWFRSLPYIGKQIPVLLLGPVLIREIISCAFVLSDILLLLETSSEGKMSIVWWKSCQSIVDAFMSLLITPNRWRTSTASQRQEILAKLTSKVSLALEFVTGLLLALDAVMSLWQLMVITPRPALWPVIQRLLCARSYANFLLVRRNKIRGLGAEIRGGASHVPVRLLDILYDPLAEMGIKRNKENSVKQLPSNLSQWTWKEKIVAGLGLNE